MNRINRMKNTRLGKIVCRLMGEEKGQAMMEYVIIGVMIAAAVALGAYFFGATILDFFGIAQEATAGKHVESASHAEEMQNTTVDSRIKDAKSNANKFGTTDTVVPGGEN